MRQKSGYLQPAQVPKCGSHSAAQPQSKPLQVAEYGFSPTVKHADANTHTDTERERETHTIPCVYKCYQFGCARSFQFTVWHCKYPSPVLLRQKVLRCHRQQHHHQQPEKHHDSNVDAQRWERALRKPGAESLQQILSQRKGAQLVLSKRGGSP